MRRRYEVTLDCEACFTCESCGDVIVLGEQHQVGLVYEDDDDDTPERKSAVTVFHIAYFPFNPASQASHDRALENAMLLIGVLAERDAQEEGET